jgi:hypothetical protein
VEKVGNASSHQRGVRAAFVHAAHSFRSCALLSSMHQFLTGC